MIYFRVQLQFYICPTKKTKLYEYTQMAVYIILHVLPEPISVLVKLNPFFFLFLACCRGGEKAKWIRVKEKHGRCHSIWKRYSGRTNHRELYIRRKYWNHEFCNFAINRNTKLFIKDKMKQITPLNHKTKYSKLLLRLCVF